MLSRFPAASRFGLGPIGRCGIAGSGWIGTYLPRIELRWTPYYRLQLAWKTYQLKITGGVW